MESWDFHHHKIDNSNLLKPKSLMVLQNAVIFQLVQMKDKISHELYIDERIISSYHLIIVSNDLVY